MSKGMTRNIKRTVLLVEDDPEDQTLTRRAFRKTLLPIDLRIVSDGQEALDYLLHQGEYSDHHRAPHPALVLLDLNMPNVDGQSVLKRIRAHPDLRCLPLVVLTTSNQQVDIRRSYDLGCNSYIVKPVEMDDFVRTQKKLESYWFDIVTLPISNN